MWKWLHELRQSWNDWVGDREMELQIRAALSQNGYFGKTAKLRDVRLIAVQRPGWLQIFSFEATARMDHGPEDDDAEGPAAPPQHQQLFGLLMDDARGKKTVIEFFSTRGERGEEFQHWSDGLLKLRGAERL